MKDVDYSKLLTPQEVAQILGCSVGTLANWRSQEKALSFTKMPNGRVYYPESSLKSFLVEVSRNQRPNSKQIDIVEILDTHRL